MIGLFHRLKIYTVHQKQSYDYEGGDVTFVPEGFCVMAFLFTSIWALYHRLWLAAFLLLAANVGIVAVASVVELNDIGAGILQLALQIWFGFAARDMLRARLKRDGFSTTAIVTGESQIHAERRFYDLHIA